MQTILKSSSNLINGMNTLFDININFSETTCIVTAKSELKLKSYFALILSIKHARTCMEENS